MWHTLIIGDLKESEGEHKWSAETIKLENAPAFGEYGDYTNERYTHNSLWLKFSEFVNIKDMFYNENEKLVGKEIGYLKLTHSFLEELRKRIKVFKGKYPDAEATYGDNNLRSLNDFSTPVENLFLCRLVWLEFWINYAIENSENPAIIIN